MIDNTFLSILATPIVTLIGILLAWWASRRTTLAQVKTDQQNQKSADIKSAAEEWRTLYDRQDNKIESMRDQINILEQHQRDSDSREYQMRRDLLMVYNWISDGAKPPPPILPEYLRLSAFGTTLEVPRDNEIQ